MTPHELLRRNPDIESRDVDAIVALARRIRARRDETSGMVYRDDEELPPELLEEATRAFHDGVDPTVEPPPLAGEGESAVERVLVVGGPAMVLVALLAMLLVGFLGAARLVGVSTGAREAERALQASLDAAPALVEKLPAEVAVDRDTLSALADATRDGTLEARIGAAERLLAALDAELATTTGPRTEALGRSLDAARHALAADATRWHAARERYDRVAKSPPGKVALRLGLATR